MYILQAENLHKSYSTQKALDGFSLDILPGTFFGLLGANGAGKSTFMNIVSGFLGHDSGRIAVDGKTLDRNDSKQKGSIGLVPQHIALYKELSSEQNLKVFGQLCGLSGKELTRQIEYALELSQLTDRRKTAVNEFSGGMKRRLNIAVALMHSPKILLCDEPTVGIDPQSRNAIFDTLIDLKSAGMTILYSTHYMEEAERLCDKIGIIDAGKILQTGSLDELLHELPDSKKIRVNAALLSQNSAEAFSGFGTVSKNENILTLEADSDFRLSRFFKWVEDEGLDTNLFQVARPNLETLFLQLTGKKLRD